VLHHANASTRLTNLTLTSSADHTHILPIVVLLSGGRTYKATLAVGCNPKCVNELAKACATPALKPDWAGTAWAVPAIGPYPHLPDMPNVPMSHVLKNKMLVEAERKLQVLVDGHFPPMTAAGLVAATRAAEPFPPYWAALGEHERIVASMLSQANTIIMGWRESDPDLLMATTQGGQVIPELQLPKITVLDE